MAVKFNPISGQFDLVGTGGGGGGGGLPVGGVQYDLLIKNSATDYDAIWSRTLDTLTVNGLLTAPDVHGSLNGPIYIYGKNTSAALIPKGTPVYITGSVGASGQIEIGPADASNAAKMPAIGLTRADVAVNDFVDVVILGVVEQLNTSLYSINSPVYVAPGGGITSTRPTATTDLVQNIGRVDRVNASTGIIVVLGPGRTNDIPNAINRDLLPTVANTYDVGSSTLDWKDGYFRATVYVGQSSGNQSYLKPNYLYYFNPSASTAFEIYTGDKTSANTSGVTIRSGSANTSGNSGSIILQTGSAATTRGNVVVNAPALTPSTVGTTTLGTTAFPWSTTYIAGPCYVGYAQLGQIYITANATNPNIMLWQSTGTNFCLIYTLDRTTGPTNKLLIRSGNTTSSGNSGDVEIATGTTAGGGTRGKVLLNGNYIDANSTKIQNLANGSSATDAIAYGQVSTAGRTGSYTDLTSTPASSTGTFTTGIKTAEFALTDAATITTTNCSSYNTFTVTIAGNRTLGSFTTGTNGQKIAIRVRQDGTGGRTLSFDSTYWNLGADVSLLSIASSANVYSYIGAIYNSTSSKWDVVSIVRGY